jgi:hypothetical protein
MLYRMLVLLSLTVLFAACTSTTSNPTATLEPSATHTSAPATPEPTTASTSTPMSVVDLPALELLSGNPDTCTNAEDYGVVLAFEARYYETTTENRVTYRLLDSDANVLTDSDGAGENKDGEEGWGFYPLAYTVPDNSALTVEVTVYATADADAPATSQSVLVYNCTTGATIDATFTRNP